MTFKAFCFWVLLATCAGSVALRASSDPPSATTVTARASVDGAARPAAASILPALTEASFAAVLAFLVAFATRGALKIALVALVLGWLALHGLEAVGVVTVHWQRAGELFAGNVLNVGEDHSLAGVVIDRVPTVVAAVVAYAFGWRRG